MVVLIPPSSQRASLTSFNQIYLPVLYAIKTFGLFFASVVSLFVWLLLEKGQSVVAIMQASSAGCLVGNRRDPGERRKPQPASVVSPYDGTPWLVWSHWHWVSSLANNTLSNYVSTESYSHSLCLSYFSFH